MKNLKDLENPLRIFIINASHYLTDHSPNGDGLVAWGYLSELARRGHRIYALSDKLDISGTVPDNLTLVEVPRPGSTSLLDYWSYMKRIRSLYEQVADAEGVDVVHQMNPVIRGLSLALVGCNVPIVLGTYVGDWKHPRNSPRYRTKTPQEIVITAFKEMVDVAQQYFATRITLATPHAMSRVPLSRFQANRIRFLHHGVDTDIFNEHSHSTDPISRPYSILFLGNINFIKGVSVLIEAFKIVAAKLPDSELILIGGGMIDEMQRRLDKHGLSGRAHFLGQLPRSEVAGWLRACTVLCAPSFGEPYGQNILEAMATGKPVIATSKGGHPYLLDANGGYQIAPGDSTNLASAIEDVLADSGKAKKMGDHNRLVIERRNTWPLVASELEIIYRDAVDSWGRKH